MNQSTNFFNTREAFIQRFSTTCFSYNKERNSFTTEASECAFPGTLKAFILVNSKTGNERVFRLVGTDKDNTGEDIFGWRYVTDCGINALIIND